MPLLRLPPEIFIQIFDQVGTFFFQQNVGRLTICKQWFEFALPVCVKYMTLYQDTLRQVVASGVISRYPFRERMETLDVKLLGYQYSSAVDEALGDNSVATRLNTLKNDLAQLAMVARQSRRLRSLRIKAWSGWLPDYPIISEDCPLSMMQTFLSLENLGVLILDISNELVDSPEHQGGDRHICPAIGALLATLQILELRMFCICPDVLKPRDPKTILPLSEVVIGLSLGGSRDSKRCGSQGGGAFQLRADLQRQAYTLATQMESPKVARIMTKREVLDVLTGQTFDL